MFRKGFDFVKRHKKKAVLAGAIYGGVYAYNNSDIVKIVVDGGCSWTWNKLVDLVPVLSSPQPEDKHRDGTGAFSGQQGSNPRSRRSERQEIPDEMGIANDDSVVATTLQLLDQAMLMMDEMLNIEALRQKISQNPPNKLELWEDMKILAWCRCFVAVYTVCHLVVYIKVQTGVASRFMCTHSSETREKLHWKLSLISRHMQCTEFLTHEGLAHLIKIVRNVVQKPVAPRALQDALSLGDIKQIVYAVRKLMEAGSSVNGFVHPRNYHLEFFMPPGQLDHSVEREPIVQSPDDRILLTLSEDANRAFESVDCNMVLNCCLEKCFSRIFTEVESLVKDRPAPSGGRIPHAALLPALDRISHIFASPGHAEPLVRDLVDIGYFGPFVAGIVRQSLQRDSLACDE